MWREVTIRLPDLSGLSDEDLRRLFPWRDGRWGAVVQRVYATLGAEQLELNALWAQCSPEWACPCCKRSKAALMRLSDTKTLMAVLHRHHDHLQDFLGHRLQAHYGAAEWVEHIPKGAYELEHLGSQMLARFTPTVVCADCNGADGKAKKALDLPRYFSFRPSEIAAFARCADHADHDVDLSVARSIFEAARNEFEERVALAEVLLDKIVRGAMTIEETPRFERPGPEAHAYLSEWMVRGRTSSGIAGDLQALLERSIARGGVGRGQRSGVRQRIIVPTLADIAAHDGGRYPKLWAKLDEAWRCPGCSRTRNALVRRAQKPGRDWSGGVQEHREYLGWSDGRPDPTRELPVARHVDLIICEDCATLGPRLKQRHVELSNDGFCLQLEDIRAVVTAQDHRRNQVDWEALRRRLPAAQALTTAFNAYDRDLSQAVEARRTYRYFLDQIPGDKAKAWRRSLQRLALIVGSASDAGEHLAYLIERADTLAPLADPCQAESAILAKVDGVGRSRVL